jgi:hypothetical protein
MNIQVKYVVIIIIVSAIAGGIVTKRYIKPQEVIKTQVVDHDVIKDRIITIVKEIDNPDGTKEKTTTTTDDRTSVDDKNTTTTDIKAPIPKQWLVSAGVGLDAKDNFNKIYQLNVNRRILGPIYVGIWGNTNQSAGLSVGFEF